MGYLDKLKPVTSQPIVNNTQNIGPSTNGGYMSKLQSFTEPETDSVKGGFLGEMFTGSTQRFGKTAGQALAAPENADLYAKSSESHSKIQNDLITAIQNKKKMGSDTSRLEKALENHINSAPKIEDFTGDVINKTTGQVLGEAGGTVLEASTGGILSSGKKILTNKVLSTGKKVLEGTKIGAAYGSIGGGLGAMQDGGGVGDVLKSGVIGGITGGVLGGGLGYAGVKVGEKLTGALNRYSNRASILAEENLNKSNKITGEILQGTPEDIARGKRALGNTDMSKVKTYAEGYDALDAQVENLVNEQDKVLGKNLNTKKLKDISVTMEANGQKIKHNYVDDALTQLDDFYTKTNNQIEKAKIAQIKNKAITKGLTSQEVNNIARIHGEKLNAFNANGELASGLTKQAAENTRMGLKNTVTEMFGSKASRAIDAKITDTLRTRDLFEKAVLEVNKLNQKIQERSLGAKAGYLIGKVVNTLGLGSPKGIVEALIPRGQGFKTLNWLEFEKNLQKNLKILTELTDKNIPEQSLIQKLETYLKGVLPNKPAKLNQYSDSPAFKPTQKNIKTKINQNIPKIIQQKVEKVNPLKVTKISKEVPINKLISREVADPERVARAKQLIQDALNGKISKRDAILVDKNNKVISGNTTLQAMKELGYKNIHTELSPTPKELLAKGKLHTPVFRKKVDNIAKQVGLKVEHGPLKTEKRLIEKANTDYKGNILEVSDINRSVMFINPLDNTSKKFFDLIKETEKEFDVVRKKFTLGTPSYNKILINVKTPGGISEIQLTTKKMWDVKINKGGDILYGLSRAERTPKKIAQHLNTRMEELYSFIEGSHLGKVAKSSNEGGFTSDLIKGVDYSGTPHISVSPFPERTIKLSGKTTTRHLAEFLEKNFDLLKKKGFAVGGWYNKVDKMTYLDVVIPIPKSKVKLAKQLGKMSNQIAGFDLEKFVEIKYGGNGTTKGVASLAERNKLISEILSNKPPKL